MTGTEEDNMRSKLLQLKGANNNFEKSIESCPKGPKDLDCDKDDWIPSEEDFENTLEVVTEIPYDDSFSGCPVTDRIKR